MSAADSSSTSSRVPFPARESDFPLWSTQIQAILQANGVHDCISSARPADPGAAPIAPVLGAIPADPIDARAHRSDWLLESNIYSQQMTAHSSLIANVRRWDRAISIITSNLGRTQLVKVRPTLSSSPGDAQALWNTLTHAYGAASDPNTVTSIFNQLSTITKLDSESMADYIGRVDSLVTDLAGQGETMSDRRLKHTLIDGLTRSHQYRATAAMMTLTDSMGSVPCTVDQVRTALVSEEKKRSTASDARAPNRSMFSSSTSDRQRPGQKGRQAPSSSSSSSSPSSSSSSPSHSSSRPRPPRPPRRGFPITCFTCKKVGHGSGQCPDNPDRDHICDKCKRRGHREANCFGVRDKKKTSSAYIAAVPSSSSSSSSSPLPPSSSSSSSPAPFIGFEDVNDSSFYNADQALAVSSSDGKELSFVVDTGATRHFCCDRTAMYDLRLESGLINGASGPPTPYSLVGRVTFKLPSHPDNPITLKDVAYVPEFTVNLLSVPRLTSYGATVSFFDDHGTITTPSSAITYSFSRKGDLYFIRPSQVYRSPSEHIITDTSYSSATRSSPSTSLIVRHQSGSSDDDNRSRVLRQKMTEMHCILGHVSYAKLFSIISAQALSGISFSISDISIIKSLLPTLTHTECIGCLKGKMHRAPMTGTIDHHTSSIMDLWVLDDSGPLPFATFNDEWYILQIMDVHSRRPWSFLTATKSEQTSVIITHIREMQTQTGLTLKRLHADKAKQFFTSAILIDFLRNNGTILDSSHEYTPQHNALIERLHRSTFEGARSSMFHSRCYPPFYGFALLFMTFVLARSISTASPTQTPIELFEKKKPSFSYMHTFGCDAHALVHAAHRNKLEPHSQEGIFLGYNPTNPAYHLIYILDTGRIIESYSTTFFDSKFVFMQRLNNLMNVADDADYGAVLSEGDVLPSSISPAQIAELFPASSSVSSPSLPIVPAPTLSSSSPPSSSSSSSSSISRRSTRSSKSCSVPKAHRYDPSYEPHQDDDSSPSVIVRRSSRISSKPYQFSPTDYDMFAMHVHIASAFVESDEPVTYQKAIHSPDAKKWLVAIQSELDSLYALKVFTVVRRQPHFNVIPHRWTFKIKRDVNGEIQRYKARLVAKGYAQLYGFDYKETFAPALRSSSLRLIFILSLLTPDYVIDQLDVKTAFLNAHVEEDLYMEVPEGMSVSSPRDMCVKLNRALYGIKQAPHLWHNVIDTFLKSLGFVSCEKENCIYFMIVSSSPLLRIIVGLFVDDIISSYPSSHRNSWLSLKQQIMKRYQVSDIGKASHVLGMRVIQSPSRISLDQRTYVKEKLAEFSLTECTTFPTPAASEQLTVNDKHPFLSNITEYRQIVGSLMYASIITRPDITHAVNMLTRFMLTPQQQHLAAAKRVLRYLAATPSLGLLFTAPSPSAPTSSSAISIVGYCDADWAGNKTDRKSTTGCCLFVNGCLVSWQTKKQSTIALSSAESELMSLTDVVKEALYFHLLLTQMKYDVSLPIVIHVDNQSAIKIASNDIFRERTKHIDTKYHFIKHHINDGKIKLAWIESKQQIADILTKTLSSTPFFTHRDKLVSFIP